MADNQVYDVIIAGARVAGSTLAILLGERGYNILLIDRARFPSDTLSTHFFRAPALRAFNEAGIYEEVQSAAPHLKVNYNVIDGKVFPEPVEKPEDYPFYMCVRRIVLDDILIRRVKQFPNIELKEGARVKEIIWDNDAIKGIKWESSGIEEEAEAKVIVGADGLNSFIAKEVKPVYEHQEPVNRAMYYAYFSGLSANEGPAAEFHFAGNTLVYCFPCDSNLTLLAVSISVNQFSNFKRNTESEFQNVLESMTELAPRLSQAVREGPIRGTGTIPGYLRIPFGKGWALAGDAAMVMDPWSGQGIDQAATHSSYLAKHIDEYFSGLKNWESAMNSYHLKRNEFSLKTYQRTCKLSADLRPMINAALAKRGLL
jgi:2-polyprenyl-6-methoxyphenol hydroxylase-like FAD-dependent oxidoreductase